MNRRELWTFLGLEIFAVIWAGGVFAVLSSRLVAGALAGGYFVVFAAWILRRIWSWPNRFQALTLYPLLVHLFLIALPMVVVRFAQMNHAFEDVHIWGLPGPVFHQLSTWVFGLLVIATVGDLTRVWLRERQPAP